MSKESRKARFLELVDGLPEATVTEEGEDGRHLGLTVRKKRFGYYLDDHHGDGVVALTCKAPPGANRALTDADPERYFIPSYTGPRGWVGIRLDLETVDWDAVELLLVDSFRMTAPKKLVALLDTE